MNFEQFVNVNGITFRTDGDRYYWADEFGETGPFYSITALIDDLMKTASVEVME